MKCILPNPCPCNLAVMCMNKKIVSRVSEEQKTKCVQCISDTIKEERRNVTFAICFPTMIALPLILLEPPIMVIMGPLNATLTVALYLMTVDDRKSIKALEDLKHVVENCVPTLTVKEKN